MPTVFGQLVIGPPGSGKTTYCKAMARRLESTGRKVAVVNLDPANDLLPYEPAVDLARLITVDDAMTAFGLGPNGALVYCMEYLDANVDWLLTELDGLGGRYLLIDCPGQVELYTHHSSVKNVVARLEEHGIRLCAVHLVDSHCCSEPGKFISALLATLSTMLQIALPQINVLSKVDQLVKHKDELGFGLDFYADVLDPGRLLDLLDRDPLTSRFARLNAALVSLVEGYGLVSFLPLNALDLSSLTRVGGAVDKANGYVYGSGEERNIQALLGVAVGAELQADRLGGAMDALG